MPDFIQYGSIALSVFSLFFSFLSKCMAYSLAPRKHETSQGQAKEAYDLQKAQFHSRVLREEEAGSARARGRSASRVATRAPAAAAFYALF